MTKRRKSQISRFIKHIEGTVKRLRADVQKRAKATGLDKKLRKTALQLERHAKSVSGHVRKYAIEIKRELSRKVRRPAKKVVARRKPRRKR